MLPEILANFKLMYRTFFAISTVLIPMAITYWIKYRFKNKFKKLQILKNESDKYYYHCLFWTMDNLQCKEHIFQNIECANNCSLTYLQTLVKLLASSKVSISMCMYHLTLRQIADELIAARDRGIKVRIISDQVISRMSHSKIRLLQQKYGFDIRKPLHQESFMHHKYCVIDAEDPNLQKMFLGSLNLTLQGCVANFEFVVITNNAHMIRQYNDEFEILWKTFQNTDSV